MADACLVARHATGRSKIVLAEAVNPQVRRVVKTYAPGFGMDVVEVPHRDGATDPDELAAACVDAACCIPAAELLRLPGARSGAGGGGIGAGSAGRRARRSALLGVLEAPGVYGCAMAIGEGQGAGNAMSFGPHYGFLAARSSTSGACPAGSG